MPFEDPESIEELNPAWPTATDPKSQGDDHMRGIKTALKNSLPNMDGPWKTANPIEAGLATEPGHLVRQDQLQVSSFGWIDEGGAVLGGSGDFAAARIGVGQVQITFDEVATSLYNQAVTAAAVGFYPLVNTWGFSIALNSTNVITITSTNRLGNIFDIEFGFVRFAR